MRTGRLKGGAEMVPEGRALTDFPWGSLADAGTCESGNRGMPC